MSKPLLVAAAALGLMAGCTSTSVRSPVPEADVSTATATIAPTTENTPIRIWGDEKQAWFNELLDAPASELKARVPAMYGKPHTYLAISGGGEHGAYGAGIINGWTASGKRPEFTMVTGISTGSLIAPFAFLGPTYDHVLTEIYTKYSTKDIVTKKPMLSMVTSDSATDSTPLKKLIARYVDANVIAAIAAEYRKGRRLWLGTTNLDAGRPVLWNIGEIASSGDPKAPDLIHQIMLASASIPGAFPPVLINVQANGKVFDEMHVDGGATQQVFLYPAGIDWKKALKVLKVPAKPDAYVIRNAFLDPVYKPTKNKIIPIAGRSVSELLRTQGIGDLYQIYYTAIRDGLDYHLAYIPDDFQMKSKEEFDPVYMRALYDVGFELGKSGKAWHDKPPD
jgi:predicted patatin/cPLA2 family phospholipase